MSLTDIMDIAPVWGLFAITAVQVFLSIEIGYWLGRYRRRNFRGEREAPVGAIVGASLGLLGFVLAFTFGLAASRFDSRRQMVVEEANAIGTTYLRAGLLPDNQGPTIRKNLREYVDARLEVVQTGDIETLLARSDRLQKELWSAAEEVGQRHPNSIVVGLFLQSLNEMIDVHAKRLLVAIQNRLPSGLWSVLYAVTFLSMAGMGYHEGLAESRRSLAIGVLVFTFSAVLTMVVDLDRPREGLLTVSQHAMIDVQKMMSDRP